MGETMTFDDWFDGQLDKNREPVPSFAEWFADQVDAVDDDGDEICPRCGAGMQATHHELCQARDGTPTVFPDDVARWCIENGYTLVPANLLRRLQDTVDRSRLAQFIADLDDDDAKGNTND